MIGRPAPMPLRLFGMAFFAAAAALLPGRTAAAATQTAAVISTGDPNIEVLSATLAAGRVQVKGFATESALLRVQGTAFRQLVDPGRTFSINLSFRTPDCRIILITGTGSLSVPLGNCAAGTSPRGPWSATAIYSRGDVVTFGGTAYAANLSNQAKRPDLFSSTQGSVTIAAVEYWRVIAEGGDQGLAGPAGTRGATGLPGLRGPKGVTGDAGAQGPDGDPGARGPTGFTGTPGIYSGAHIVSEECDEPESYTFSYIDGFFETEYYYCVAACPAGETGVAGWESWYSEGAFASVVSPRIFGSVENGEEFAGRYAVSDWTAHPDPEAFQVAIACVPEIDSPLD